MSELKEGWREEFFLDIFNIQGGSQPPKKDFIYEEKEGYIRLLQIRDFGDKPLPTYIPASHKLKTCCQDDILIARYGASLGRICTGMSGAYNVAMAKVIIPNNFDKRFVFHLLKSSFFQNEILKLERSAQDGFNKDDLAKIKVPLPPTINDQKEIVEKLEAVLRKLSSARSRIDKIPLILKRFRQSVLSAACSGRLTAEWRNGREIEENNVLKSIEKYYRTFNTKDIKKIGFYYSLSEIYDMVACGNWIKCNIGAIGKVSNGSTPPTKISEYWNGNINWVSSGEVKNNIINRTQKTITMLGYENSSVLLLKKGTVLIAMIGEGKTRGQTAILNIEAAINQNIAAIDLSHGYVDSKYLWYWFRFCYQQNREIGNGSGPKALNCDRVRELKFICPPFSEQEEIVRRLDALFVLADKVEQRYINIKSNLERAEKAVYAKAFRGEL